MGESEEFAGSGFEASPNEPLDVGGGVFFASDVAMVSLIEARTRNLLSSAIVRISHLDTTRRNRISCP
jgi:hypothetical protein